MNGLVIAPAYDSGGAHPHDATGAFQPGARAFAKLHGLPPPVLFDNRPTPTALRLPEVLRAIRAMPPPLDILAIFSHGWRTGTQWGGAVGYADAIAIAVSAMAAADIVIALYACSAGEDVNESAHPGHHENTPGAGDGSFADALRDKILAHGKRPRILAHATVGHAYRNPYVRVFDASTTAGGEWLIEPGSADWHAWADALKDENRMLWARFPTMSREQVLTELHAPHAA